MHRYEAFVYRTRASGITVGGVLCASIGSAWYFDNDDQAIQELLKEVESEQVDNDSPIPDKVVVGSIYRHDFGEPPQEIAKFVLRGEIEPERLQIPAYIPINKPKLVLGNNRSECQS